ncbi:hypothetical protein L1049_006786 [Liquidambar formosana]|uniref:BSD domain-containing protein n=1 Tax=Liquidambar formosana TaxID=63359 RepID=A0AAP0RHK1_LIQFO
MDIWQSAKSFAEEAAKKTQALTRNANISDIVSETAKKSKEFAVEASKKADQIKLAALQQSDFLKSLSLVDSSPASPHSASELEKFGVTDDLREFVKGLTVSTFQNFPLQDEPQASDVPTVSNVRQDLSEWQEKHANLMLTTVKEISKLRYELCPRLMKERKFWRIYFTLVSSHVAPYEKQYMEEVKLKVAEQSKDEEVNETPIVGETLTDKNLKSQSSSSAEQDLDSFLLGDLEDADEGPDDGDRSFDDDFDKIDNSDIEDGKYPKKPTG